MPHDGTPGGGTVLLGLLMSTRAIWDQGTALADADWRFAPQALRDEHNAVVSTINSTPAPVAVKHDLVESLAMIHSAANALAAPAKVRSKMRDHLLDRLATRSLVAYGYVVPRHPSDAPIEVPADMFDRRYVDWGKSALKGQGLEFAAVRVLHPTTVQKMLSALPQPSPAPARRRPGPDPSAPKIEAAISALLGANKLDRTAPHKVNIPLIRARLHELFPGHFFGADKPKNETIRKVWERLRGRSEGDQRTKVP